MKINFTDLSGWLVEKAVIVLVKLGWILFLLWSIKFFRQESNQWTGLFDAAVIWLLLVLWYQLNKYRKTNRPSTTAE